MDFFQAQDRARSKTAGLVFFFLVFSVLFACCLTFALSLIAPSLFTSPQAYEDFRYRGIWLEQLNLMLERPYWYPLLSIFGGTCFVIIVGTVYKALDLARIGGRGLVERLGARQINSACQDDQERRLLNVIEEISLAAGIPVPAIYVLDRETGYNAFVAGSKPGDVAITVTRGALDQFSRDELQSVIAHEFSHIFNSDATLNMRCIGVIFGIQMIALLGREVLFRMRNVRGRNAGGVFMFGLALFLIGSIGYVCGQIIRCAISRQREFLADAAAVQFTRNPTGLVQAFKKILGLDNGGRMESIGANAHVLSHMFFVQGITSFFGSLFSTHPPLDERIRRIDARAVINLDKDHLKGVSSQLPESVSAFTPAGPRPSASIGKFDNQSITQASKFAGTVPGKLIEATRDPFSAVAIVLGILLSDDSDVRTRQLDRIGKSCFNSHLNDVNRYGRAILDRWMHWRLAAVHQCMPALQKLSPPQKKSFLDIVGLLMNEDNVLDLFEYAVLQILRQSLGDVETVRERFLATMQSRYGVEDVATILSAVIATNGRSYDENVPLFKKALEMFFGLKPGSKITPPKPDLRTLDTALRKYANSSPRERKKLIDLCAKLTLADQNVTLTEWHALQAISAALGCPLPPNFGLTT